MEGLSMLANRPAMFLLGTVGLVYVSWASLREPRSHGFWRFWAWEAILALILLNLDQWFRDPFSWHQLISWVLLWVAGFLVIYGVILLKRAGRQDPGREDPSLLEFEKTARLVTSGLYGYIRHPMYSSLLFLAWGVFFKAPSWLGGGLAVAATGFLVAAGRMEEAEDIRYFGDAYRAYMKRTKMFIPWLF
jgi:protein-S-isoprenylcysteine O-methyltransferase Ste14